MRNYEIRNCTPEDLHSVYEMICTLEGENPGIEEFTEVYSSNLNDKNIFYIVAESEGKAIAFSSIHIQQILHHTGKVAELMEMYVEPDFRDSGIGEAMFWNLRDKAEACGCRFFEISSNIVRDKTKTFFENRGVQLTHYKFTERL